MPRQALKRALSLAADGCLLVLLVTLAGMIAPPRAMAYVDPSVMTYTIQAVAGAAVALSAVLGVAFRRTRKLVFRLFKVDENAGKEVDPPVHRAWRAADKEAFLAEADQRALALRAALDHRKPPRRLGWPRRLVRSLLCCLFLVLTMFTAPALEIVAGAQESLNFGFYDVLPLVLQASAVAVAGGTVVLSLFRGRAFDILCALIVAWGLCCYLQSLFLNGPLAAADGSAFDLARYGSIVVWGTVLWAVVIAGFLALSLGRPAISRGLGLALSLGLVLVQGAALATLAVEPVPESRSATSFNGLMTTEGLYELGSQDNVVVLVLDTYDTSYLDELVAQDPHILDPFTGFTWFRNATSAMIPTRYGIPYLLTGVMPQPGQGYQDYLEGRYEQGTLIPSISQAGYEVGIYTDSLLTDALTPYARNLHDAHRLKLNEEAVMDSLVRMALYREMPWVLKEPFWFYTDQVNNSALDASMDSYGIDDPAFFQHVREQGLTVGESERAFRFIHFLGAHQPLSMDEQGNRGTEETLEWRQQFIGSLNMVATYLDEMRRLGLYDSATVMITADHGFFDWTDGTVEVPSSALLMVKPAETAQQAAAPLKVSEAPTGAVDVAATLLVAAGADRGPYGSTVWEVPADVPRERLYWNTAHQDHVDEAWVQYAIDGDVLDMDDWRRTGEVIPLGVHD